MQNKTWERENVRTCELQQVYIFKQKYCYAGSKIQNSKYIPYGLFVYAPNQIVRSTVTFD